MIKLVLIAWTSLVPPHVYVFPGSYTYLDNCLAASRQMFARLKDRRRKGVDITTECRQDPTWPA